ncbi:MAG: hypothetical protein WA001_02270 [Patescibacteria group bacterium]
MKRRAAAGLFVALVLVFPRHPAKAETFFFKGAPQDSVATALIIDQPQQLQRFFGRIETKDDVDYYTFAASKDMAISLSLEIPTGDTNFHPSITLFGPGLQKPNEDPVIEIGDANGAIVEEEPKQPTTRRDGFLLTSFFEGPYIKTTAPQDATYAIAVRAPDGSSGRYVLHVGTQDSWDWNNFFVNIWNTTRAILRMY